MKELVLREELSPDDVVVVVRGGEMNSDFVRRTATRSYEEVGVFTVSVFLALEDAVEELCRSVEDLERYGKVRLSTVGRLRSLGFALLPRSTRHISMSSSRIWRRGRWIDSNWVSIRPFQIQLVAGSL